MTEMKIGSASGSTTAFSALSPSVKEPAQTLFYPFSEQITTASGITVGKGFPLVVMIFKTMTRAQRDALKAFAAATVYIYIPTNESNQTFGYYSGKMQWPKTEKWVLNVIEDLEVHIIHLVAYTP